MATDAEPDAPADPAADVYENPERLFYPGVLGSLTNGSFVEATKRDGSTKWWCAEERFDCRHAHLRLTRGMFWFGHKLPPAWGAASHP